MNIFNFVKNDIIMCYYTYYYNNPTKDWCMKRFVIMLDVIWLSAELYRFSHAANTVKFPPHNHVNIMNEEGVGIDYQSNTQY